MQDWLKRDSPAHDLVSRPVPDGDVRGPVVAVPGVEEVRPHRESSRGGVPLKREVGNDPGDAGGALFDDGNVHGRLGVVLAHVGVRARGESGVQPGPDVGGCHRGNYHRVDMPLHKLRHSSEYHD